MDESGAAAGHWGDAEEGRADGGLTTLWRWVWKGEGKKTKINFEVDLCDNLKDEPGISISYVHGRTPQTTEIKKEKQSQ